MSLKFVFGKYRTALGIAALGMLAILCEPILAQEKGRLPGSAPLLPDAGDLNSQRKQIFDYFQGQIEAAQDNRDDLWQPDFSSKEAYHRSLEDHRDGLRKMLGLITGRPEAGLPTLQKTDENEYFRVERVTIPITTGLAARGLLFTPSKPGPKPAVIICPDADTWPEKQFGIPSLISSGSVVFVMQSIERLADHPYCEKTRGKDRRVILYRLGFVVGRSMPGIDVQDALAVVEFLAKHKDVDASKISITGKGQGGMTALMTAALDTRIAAATVSDYFDSRNRCWAEPVDRRLRGQLVEFGDAELSALIAPRKLTIEASDIFLSAATNFNTEFDRAERFYEAQSAKAHLVVVKRKISRLENDVPRQIDVEQVMAVRNKHFEERLAWLRKQIDESEGKRSSRWKILEQSPDKFPETQKAMLKNYRQMTGELPDDGTPMNVRSELALTTGKYKIYRVTIDVRKGVSIFGNLVVPQHIEGKRPAVICQHGFGGYPNKITGLGMTEDTAYHEYGRKLAEKGYVVFAPMLLHISPSEEVSRQMRQANAVGMMRLAMPLAKTERVIDFLESLPYVDKDRIAYYGLSYGGYSAVWMPPLLDRLALTICSGNFNDWRSKITSDELNTSYLRHPDEDMYSWNCLNRFTHPELIAMMNPRPVCIEYGNKDGITTPEWTVYAWKQTKAFADHLKQSDRVILNEFDGPHEIHGVETFEFLDKWLMKERYRKKLPETEMQKTLLRIDFSNPDELKGWRLPKGLWTIENGTLKGVEILEDKHSAGAAHALSYHDAKLSFRFQLSGAGNGQFLMRNRFGNLCRLVFTADYVRFQKDKPNIPRDTKEKTVFLAKETVSLSHNEWHQAVIVIQGETFSVEIDKKQVLEGSHPGINVPKTEVEFFATGDAMFYDDLRVEALESIVAK